MSWIEAELRRREALASQHAAPKSTQPADLLEQARGSGILALWDRLEAANAALPQALRLRRDSRKVLAALPGAPIFLVWLVATNGAALGLTAEGIRYVWPEENKRNSHNFWIYSGPKKGFRLVRRVGPPMTVPTMAERRFDEAKLDEMLRCLVTSTRVDYKAVSRGWLRSLF